MPDATTKPLYILAAALEAGCTDITIRRSIKLGRISAELEVVNGRPTWIIDRQNFNAWAANRRCRSGDSR